MTPHVQVAILGGGPGGAALALTLVRENISVLLIEGTDYETLRVGELLSPEGVKTLRLLLPGECESYFLASLGVASAWDTRELIRQPYAEPWRALDRTGLDRALAYTARREGAELFVRSKLNFPARNREGGWDLEIVHQNGVSPYRADLLVDATGRGSRLARHLGSVRRKSDDQTAIVAFLDTTQGPPLASDMLLETTDEGWWYAAPITDTSAVAVFVTDLGMSKGESELAWRQAMEKTVHIKQRYATYPFSERTRRVAAENSMIG